MHLGLLQLSWMTQGYNCSKDVRRHKLKESDTINMWASEAKPTNRAAEGLPGFGGPGEITHVALPFTAKPRANPPRSTLQSIPQVAVGSYTDVLPALTLSGKSQHVASLQSPPSCHNRSHQDLPGLWHLPNQLGTGLSPPFMEEATGKSCHQGPSVLHKLLRVLWKQ